MSQPPPRTYVDPDGRIITIGGATIEEQEAAIAALLMLGGIQAARDANHAALLNPLAAQANIDANRMWRDSPRAAEVLALEGDLDGNLLRNIVQDLIRQSQRQARQLNALWRLALASTSPAVLDDIDPPDA